ncbi:DUF2065 domain-containing protein [Shewanella sp. WXL01]|uniref:DUF2065 domain-containing protein n=1 Tax=Shewanella maritima TaxID=2520507 RepID=A0A411PG24_9GAMM|nr:MULTISPECIES: DUF2065 domain-containing protein [Shewanella]NKF49455.1 DUF2065 domain-containing protein [Shewanella sp. WXL01]QBF82438.1 DUF2065 domain-containing protein [Shewanella maritima]
MSFETIMVAIAMVLILEGIGPMIFPEQWKNYLLEISKQNQNVLRRLGGSLFTAGVVLLIIFS